MNPFTVYRLRLNGTVFTGYGLVAIDRDEGDLATVVDIRDLDLDLLADVDNILYLLDALLATELGDVDESVAARKDGDEGTEVGDLHHGAEELSLIHI